MNRKKFSTSTYKPFEIQQINFKGKIRDSPTSSILKTPTAIFVTTRDSSAKTKKLKFANGPVDLLTLRNGSHESSVSVDSGVDSSEDRKLNNGEVACESNVIEVAVSPVKTMQVSPESWKAFLEYRKYNDYANETEKTDYTYSRLSKYRHKEIIPGFLIRPNLSRSSLSSRHSSFSSPSSLTSYNESFSSGSYDFKIHEHPSSETISNLKTPNQSKKFSRSKYFLRSSTYDGADTGDVDSKPAYLESDHESNSTREKFSKAFYSSVASEVPEPTSTPYYAKLRYMDLDDADIDEVDVNPVKYQDNQYLGTGEGANLWSREKEQLKSGVISNFFTSIFLYVTSAGMLTKDLFSKYILRSKDDLSQSRDLGWRSDATSHSTTGGSWIPWKQEKVSSFATSYPSSYYSDMRYGHQRNWYQRLYHYFYESFSKFANLIWGSSPGYYRTSYDETTRKRKIWWFLIPLLLLGGSFLGYIDFFSNPKAVLNTMYNWVLFIPSFLYYTVMVFIPRLIFETIPYLILTGIPHFVTVILFNFFTTTIPYYFWVVVHFFANMSISNIWNLLVGIFYLSLNWLAAIWEFIYYIIFESVSTGYSLSSKYLMFFYSNFSMTFFNILTHLFNYVASSCDAAFYAFDYVRSFFLK